MVAFGTCIHALNTAQHAPSSAKKQLEANFFLGIGFLIILKVCEWLLKIFIKSHCSGTMKLFNASEILHEQSSCGGAEDQHLQKLEALAFCPLQN